MMRTADKTLLASIYMYIQYLTQIYLLRHFYGMQPYIVKWIKGMIFVGHNILHYTFIFLLFKLQFSIMWMVYVCHIVYIFFKLQFFIFWIELEIIVIFNCFNDIKNVHVIRLCKNLSYFQDQSGKELYLGTSYTGILARYLDGTPTICFR